MKTTHFFYSTIVSILISILQMFGDIPVQLTWWRILEVGKIKPYACSKEPALSELCFVIISLITEMFPWQQVTCSGQKAVM